LSYPGDHGTGEIERAASNDLAAAVWKTRHTRLYHACIAESCEEAAFRRTLAAFEWPAASGGYNTRVEMTFRPLDDRNTMVQISESGWREDPAGIKESYGNAGGWMHMMCCLKAYLEYGINLRAGGGF
jgi:uncharacterized protein YndB with AHSA1/START domain